MVQVELKPEEKAAQELIDAFLRQYGEDGKAYLNLASYAAFPLVLTPDLLYQIWAIFFAKETPWIAVAQILLSPLCQEIGHETYEMELPIRNQLLKGLNEQQLTEIGQLMLQYIEKRLIGIDPYTENLKERQEITALAYIKPSEAAKKLVRKLSRGIKPEDIREAFRWTTLIKTLANPLIDKGFKPLFTYKDIVVNAAFGKTDTSDYRHLVNEFEQEQSEFIKRIGIDESLILPFNNNLKNLLSQINIKLTTFEVQVAKIAFDDEINYQEQEEEKAQLWQFETVFVNNRGEIIQTLPCSAYYYKESLDVKNRNEAIYSSEVDNNDWGSEPTQTVEPLTMIYIPEGELIMGSDDKEKDRDDDESPQHRVKIAPFYMSQTPITQAQWRAIATLPQVERELNLNPSYSEGDENPVENIDWYDAIEYCARLSIYTGREYRLPSEAEWEYACRGFKTPPVSLSDSEVDLSDSEGALSDSEDREGENPINTKVYPPFHFGDTITDKLANYRATETSADEPLGEYRSKTTPVRTFKPNAFGLYDMHGNVWEWCLDPWHSDYNGAPTDGRVWDEENSEDDYYHDIVKNIKQLLTDERSHVHRGGSYDDLPRICRSAIRSYNLARGLINGLRVVCGLPRSS